MKTLPFLAVAFAVVLNSPALANTGSSYGFIKTLSGKVYTNCRVFKTDPDGVMIAHQDGGAKLLFADLTPESRAMLGYDPEKEAAYEKELAEKRRKEREELWKYRTELAKAQAAAYDAEAMRMALFAMQGPMGGYVGGYVGGYGGGYVGGYPLDAGYAPGFGYGYDGYGLGYGGLGCGYGSGYGLSALYGYNFGYNVGPVGYNPYSCGLGLGFGNYIGAGPFIPGVVTRGGVTFPAPNNCGNGWRGNSWNGRFGHNFRSNCGTPALNVVGRPLYNIAPPCRVPLATPAIGRLTPALGTCVRR